MNPLNVVVIMPLHNNRDTVAAAVRSALGEPQISAIIVIDDGSTDDSLAVVQSMDDSRIKVETQPNAGPSAARNRGIERALHHPAMTHILFLDADDEWIPGGVGHLEQLLAERPDLGLIVGARLEVGEGAEHRVDPPAAWVDQVVAPRGAIFLPQPFFGTSGMLVARSIVELGVRFDPRLRIGEDRDFAYRAAAIAPAFVTSHTLLKVRLHNAGSNLTGPDHLDRWLRDLLQLIDWHAQDEGAARPLHQQSDWLLGHASRTLARQGRRIDAELWRAYMARYRSMNWPRPKRALKWRFLIAPIRRLFR